MAAPYEKVGILAAYALGRLLPCTPRFYSSEQSCSAV